MFGRASIESQASLHTAAAEDALVSMPQNIAVNGTLYLDENGVIQNEIVMGLEIPVTNRMGKSIRVSMEMVENQAMEVSCQENVHILPESAGNLSVHITAPPAVLPGTYDIQAEYHVEWDDGSALIYGTLHLTISEETPPVKATDEIPPL